MDKHTAEFCAVCRNSVNGPDSCDACAEGKAAMLESQERVADNDPYGFFGTLAPEAEPQERDDYLDDEIPF